MFNPSIETAILNSLIGNALLAGIFLYLWWMDRRESALGYWAAAYAASACRVLFRMAGLEGYSEAIFGEALFGAGGVVLIGMGARVFIGRPFASPWLAGLIGMAALGSVSVVAAIGWIPVVVPYLIAGMVFFFAGLAMLRRGRDYPGVGYSIVGFLFALYGGYAFVFSQQISAPDDPGAYISGPIINLAIGMVLLVVTQRKQHFEAEKLNAALLREAEGRRAAEDVGIRSEERYRAILDTTRSLVGLLTPEGILIDLNRAALVRAGIRREEVIGKPFWDTPWWAHDAEQLVRLRQAIRRVAAGGHDRFEATHPAPDGGLGYFNFFLTPIRDASGQVVYLVPEAHDITARRRIEQSLHVAEQRFRAISEGSMLGVFATEPDGRVTFFSARASEITGISAEEAEGGRLIDHVLPEDREQLRMQWRTALVERKPFVGERRYLRGDGRHSWGRIHVAPILDGMDLLGFVGTVEDVSVRKQTEQALRDSEDRFSSFFSLSPVPSAVASYPDGKYIQVNEAWEQTYGFRQSEAAGRTALDLGLWEHPADRSKIYAEIVRRGEARSGEIRMRNRNGDPIYVTISGRVLEVGQSRLILWNTYDNTDKRHAEDQLRISEEKFSKAFLSSPDYMTISRLSDGSLLDCNEAFERFTGYGRAEAIGRSTLDLGIWLHPEERAQFVAILGRDGWLRDFECTLCGRDGLEMTSLVTASTIEINGEPCVIAVARDVGTQRRMEQELRASEEMFSTIFHRSPVALGVTTVPEGRYLDVNETWEKQFRYTREQMLGRTSLEIGLWLDPEERGRLFADLDADAQVHNRDVHFRRGDGAEILCELSGHVFTLNGEQVLLWGAHDVTEHRNAQRQIEELNQRLEARVQERTSKLEKANAELGEAMASLQRAQNELVRAEKLAALGSLVAGVAHELNTPIGNSVTVASTLYDKTRDFGNAVVAGKLRRSTLDNYLEDALTGSELLLRSLMQANELISSFKQVAVDQASAQRRRFDLKLVVEEVIATLSPMLKKTPFKLELDLADKVVMDSYPGPIGQVLTNLVTNSLAHAFEDRDAGVMHLSARRRGLHQVEMVFTDDGVGISESDMKRVFDPFFTTKLGRGGSGLGLHIVYSLVTRVLGGRIEATSRQGSGTRFQISLPMKAPDRTGQEP